MKTQRETITVGVALLGVAIAAAKLLTGCAEDKQLGAESAYEAQQLACVDQYADRQSLDACRAKVKAAWSTADAGKDAR